MCIHLSPFFFVQIQVIKDHLPSSGLCVVFVETKRGADALEMNLHQAESRRETENALGTEAAEQIFDISNIQRI